MAECFERLAHTRRRRASQKLNVRDQQILASWLGSLGPFGVVRHSYFPAAPFECSCSVIHLSASYSVIKPLIASISPSGHRISTPQPDPGFFRATKVGRCSDILRICACGGQVQASYPATIKLMTNYWRARPPGLGLTDGGPGFAGCNVPIGGASA